MYRQADLANNIGIARSPAQEMLYPGGRAPGLSTQATALNSLKARAGSANEHRASRNREHPSREPQRAAEPETVRLPPQPRKLNHDQHEHLAALVQMDPRALPQIVTADLAQQAVARAELPGEVIEHLTTFLAAQTSDAAS